jgi:hypothetical protein
MRIGLAAAVAVASALLFTSPQAAHAGPAMKLKDGLTKSPNLVELVGRGGRGGGGFKGGGMRGGSFKGGGGGFKGGMRGGGRSYGMRGGGPKMGAYRGGRGYAGRSYGGGGKHVHRGGKGRHAGHHHWRGHKGHRHRHARFYGWPGVGYGVYAYGYGNCSWLRRQALITGSPYWWSRYEQCLYYY